MGNGTIQFNLGLIKTSNHRKAPIKVMKPKLKCIVPFAQNKDSINI